MKPNETGRPETIPSGFWCCRARPRPELHRRYSGWLHSLAVRPNSPMDTTRVGASAIITAEVESTMTVEPLSREMVLRKYAMDLSENSRRLSGELPADNVARDSGWVRLTHSRVRLKIRGPANLAGAWSAQPVPASPRPPRAAQRPAAARAPRAYERTNAKPASRVGQGSQTRGGTHPGCKATPE